MKPELPAFPKRLEIELVSDCNLRCVYCPRHHVNDLKGYINVDLFKKVIDEASAYPDTIIVLHRRGESLLHPQFKEMLRYIEGRFKEVQLATNATQLTEDKFEAIVRSITFLSFSLDSPVTYDTVRVPAKYRSVEQKIHAFLAYNKGRVKTQASMVRTDSTLEENVEIFKAAWQGKVDRVRIYEEHSKDGVFGALTAPRRERRTCVMPFYEVLIYDSGQVGRCNHDWNGDEMGDANLHSVREIWNSRKYRQLRDEQLSLSFTDDVCKNCDSWYAEIGNQGTGEVIEK